MFKISVFSVTAPNNFLGLACGPGMRVLKKHRVAAAAVFPTTRHLHFRACGGFTAGRGESLRATGQLFLALPVLLAPRARGASSSCGLCVVPRRGWLAACTRFPAHSHGWNVHRNSGRCRQAVLLVIAIWTDRLKEKPSENCVMEFLPFSFPYFWCLKCRV